MKRYLHVLFLFLTVIQSYWIVSATVIGIDFGSSSFKVMLVQRDFNLVLNEQSSRKTKNVISIKDGTRNFGSQAENVGRFSPQHSYKYLRDLLGKTSPTSPGAQQVLQYVFYADKLIQSPSLYSNGTPSEYFHIAIKNDDDPFHPILAVHELVAMVFSQAHKMAEKAAAGPVVDCVITVPAYFTQRERQALVDAATLGGLKVLSLINEGTAFGLKYAIDRSFTDDKEEENVLFYDHGEGSLQLTLINFSKTKNKKNVTVPQVKVVATSWDTDLGTREFDRRLGNLFAEDIQKKHGFDIKQNLRAYAKLIAELQKCREVLSANKEASFMVEGLTNDLDYGGKITRESFEAMNADLFSNIVPRIESLLEMADIPKEQVDAIEMVGGAIRVPKIQEVVKEFFGRETLDFHINADEGAVFGASYFAAGLSVQHRVKELNLKDITPWKVVVNVSDVQAEGEEPLEIIQDTDESVSDEAIDKFATLFRRGNRYKSRKTLSFHTTRPFQLQLRYAEEEEKDNWLPKGTDPVIETYVFDGLPSTEKYNYTGKPKVHVQFLLSTSGIIELVKAEAEITVVQYVSKAQSKEDNIEIKSSDEEEQGEEEFSEEAKRKEENEDTEAEAETETETEAEAEGEGKAEEVDTEKEDTQSNDETTEEEAHNETETEEKETESTISESVQTEEVIEEVRKTIKIPLIVQSSQKHQLPSDSLKRSQKILQDFEEKDRIRFNTENARNELESFIYDTQDKLYDDTFISMSTEEERQALSDALSSASVWLEDNTDATLSDLITKKSEVTTVGESIFFRLKESTARNDAFSLCAQTINFTKANVENITQRLEVAEVEVEELLDLCDDTLNWMVQKYTEQESHELWKDPLVTSDQINQKCRSVTKLATRLLKRPKKKPPKVEKVVETDKQSTTTEQQEQQKDGSDKNHRDVDNNEQQQTNDEQEKRDL